MTPLHCFGHSRRALFSTLGLCGLVALPFAANATSGVVRPSALYPFTPAEDTGTARVVDRSSGLAEPVGLGQPDLLSPGAASAFPERPPDSPETSPGGSAPIPIVDNGRGPTNFRIGPVRLRAAAGLSFEFNDNITASSDRAESELIISPGLSLTGNWQISPINDLTLRLGVSYSYYVSNPDLSPGFNFELVPGTELAFKVKIGDFSVLLFERPSLQQAPSDDGTLPSGFLYSQFDNSIGLTVFWDGNQVRVQGTYDHRDTIPIGDGRSDDGNDVNIDALRRTVDTLSGAVSVSISDEMSAGVEGAVSSVRRDIPGGDGITAHAGVFLDRVLTRSTTVHISAGYQHFSFDSSASSDGEGSSDSSGIYGSISVRNRLNRFVTQSISVGREADLGATTNSAVTTYIRADATLQTLRGLSFSIYGGYELIDQSGLGAESYNRFTFGAQASYALTQRTSVALAYSFITRQGGDENDSFDADENRSFRGIGSAGAYTQNRVILSFSYAF